MITSCYSQEDGLRAMKSCVLLNSFRSTAQQAKLADSAAPCDPARGLRNYNYYISIELKLQELAVQDSCIAMELTGPTACEGIGMRALGVG